MVNIGAISYDSSLRKYAGMPSGPVALWVDKRLETPSSDTDMLEISGKEQLSIFGSEHRSSWVKTEVK